MFVDLEKYYDRVPRELVEPAKRMLQIHRGHPRYVQGQSDQNTDNRWVH